jgi:hypothetical protein
VLRTIRQERGQQRLVAVRRAVSPAVIDLVDAQVIDLTDRIDAAS